MICSANVPVALLLFWVLAGRNPACLIAAIVFGVFSFVLNAILV
jgi:hypothetical protein